MKLNSIYLRRRRKVLVPPGQSSLPENYIASIQMNIEPLGYTLSKPLMDRLQTLSIPEISDFYKALESDLRSLVGAHRPHKPMYPNFPSQVMEMSWSQLYLNALIHYLTNDLPRYAKLPRDPLDQHVPPKVIDLGTQEDFEGVFTRMARSKTSLSDEDKADLAWFIFHFKNDVTRLLPDVVPFKENLAVIGACLLLNTTIGPDYLSPRIKTATDVLRLAVAISAGDVSLAKPCKFKVFPRAHRKLLLSWLQRMDEPVYDMLRWKEPWKRLGERLHPGDYKDKFPKALAAFDTLRNDRPCLTFSSRVEGALSTRDVPQALALMMTRPGEFARRLDHLVRITPNPEPVLAGFSSVVSQVSTPVLLQVLTHFENRSQPRKLRPFFPKGQVAKVFALRNNLAPVSVTVSHAIAQLCTQTLVSRFAKLPPLGRCYLDPALSNFLVPFSQRSASKSLRTLVRGSRMSLPDANCIRLFLWWMNGSGRTDIDLSAAVFDKDCNFLDAIAYYNLKNYGGCHSGDIVDAPQGAAEFIDLDIPRTLETGARYVVTCINSFTMQPYCNLPECFAGWMARTAPGSGEVFEPRTVQDKVDIASDTRTCLPAIFDLVDRQMIWADIALAGAVRWNNVHNNLTGVSLMLRSMLDLVKTDLHTLFSMHIQARGQLVTDKAVAETVFGIHEGITPFDIPKIASDFM